MRSFLYIVLFLCSTTAVFAQNASRIFLAGTKISIEQPENVLVPKHTSTLFIDSTIEFATVEFPNAGIAKKRLKRDRLSRF